MAKLYALNEADRELLKRTIRKVDAFFKAAPTWRRHRQVVDVMPYFAKVKTAWSAATPNQITATISYQDGSLIAGGRDWTVYLSMPTTNEPPYCALAVDDVIAFMPIYDVANTEWRGIILGMLPLPKLASRVTDYMLVNDSADGIEWIETTESCPE